MYFMAIYILLEGLGPVKQTGGVSKPKEYIMNLETRYNSIAPNPPTPPSHTHSSPYPRHRAQRPENSKVRLP